MKKLIKNIIILLFLCFFSINIYWLMHKNEDPTFYMKTNITICLIPIVTVLFPAIQQRLKNDKKENIFISTF